MVKVTGKNRHIARLKAMPARTRDRAGKAIFVAADQIKSEAQFLIVNGSIQGKGHIPSLPGEPPNRDTAQLDTSIVARRTGELTAEVTVEAEHGVYLELGTSRMEERPFMRPAVRNKKAVVTELVGRAVSIAIRTS